MSKNILVFRTDRIGDLLLTCPSIKTIKEQFPGSKINIVTSEKNFEYSKTFDFIDNTHKFPTKFILKIVFFFKLLKKKYDIIYIFDGKDRSILFSCFLKSPNKVSKIVNNKQAWLCKLFKIKTSFDFFGKDLNDLHQNLLNYSGLTKKIYNFDFLTKKNDNNFS